MGYITIIPEKEHLTSNLFYSQLLRTVNSIIQNRKCETEEIVFDFTGLKSINSLVLPNLLTLGVIIKSHDIMPTLLVTPRLSSDDYDNINYFLSYSGFFEVNKKYDIFNLPIYRKEITRFNKILMFSFENNDSHNRIIKELWTESKEFISSIIEKTNIYKKIDSALLPEHIKDKKIDDLFKKYSSDILNPISQLSNNSIVHGNSYSFISLSHIEKNNNVLISVSDFGMGFYNSINAKIKDIEKDESLDQETREIVIKLYEESQNKTDYKDLYSIIIAMIYRGLTNSRSQNHHIYGINSVANFFLSNNGFIRIHSNEFQIILSNKFLPFIEKDKILKLPNELIKNKGYNLRKTPEYPGVHIEMELCLDNLINTVGMDEGGTHDFD